MKLTIDQALQKGIEAQKTGKAEEADRYYTAILKAQPKHPDANHNMGLLAVGLGKVHEALPFFKRAIEANSNIAQFWLSYINALIKLERTADAKTVFDQAKSAGAKGDAFEQVEPNLYNPPHKLLQNLSNLHDRGMYQQVLKECEKAIKEYPKSYMLYNIIGLANAGLGFLDTSVTNYKKAISGNPYHAASYYNMGVVLQQHDLLDQALKAYKKSLNIRPNYAQAHYNMGKALRDLGLLEEAVSSYQKALSIKPDYAEALNNMANALKDLGETEKALVIIDKALAVNPNYANAYFNKGSILRDIGLPAKAISSYQKALSIKPDYAEALNNMANALKDLGRTGEAISVYKRVIDLQPDNPHAHRSLTKLQKYTSFDAHFRQVKKLYSNKNLSDEAKSHLGFALAKMYEDLGKDKLAFEIFCAANASRKKTLSYSIHKDQRSFERLKKVQPILKKKSIQFQIKSDELLPIFIVGMPRSGTTLVEQIISSHSKVSGAGELPYVAKYGQNLATTQKNPTKKNILDFSNKYLLKLGKRAHNKRIVTDKMPQNFLFLPLILSAFDGAKIVHVHRDARATCWSIFKHYFADNNLGFAYDLMDIVSYYQMYFDLMKLWQSQYSNKIYNLDYEKLTNNQELETRRLIKYLGLTWENRCLSPQKNNRSVATASQQQVRKKVYKGSSKKWEKYEKYLNGAFDCLKNL